MDKKLTLEQSISPLIKTKLSNYPFDEPYTNETALLHDLGLYGDEAGSFLVKTLFKDEEIDWSGFKFDQYFPCNEIGYGLINPDQSILSCILNLFKTPTVEELAKQKEAEKRLYSSYPKFTFAMVAEILSTGRWCFTHNPVGPLTREKLVSSGFSPQDIDLYCEHTAVLHDLKIYGDSARALLANLFNFPDNNQIGFEFNKYFPDSIKSKKGKKYHWYYSTLDWYLLCEYPRLTFTMIETTLEQKKWLYY